MRIGLSLQWYTLRVNTAVEIEIGKLPNIAELLRQAAKTRRTLRQATRRRRR